MMQTTTIDLLRHGACEGGDIFRGSTDSSLSEIGQQQMLQALKNYPSNSPDSSPAWQQLICSPLQRCQTVAKQLAEQQKCNLHIEPALQEIHFGDWEGQLTDEVYQQSPEAVSAFWKNPVANTPPNGEPLVEFQQRIQNAWQQLLKQYRGQHCLVITHGGVIRLILAELLQMPLRPVSYISVPHACLTQIKIFHQPGDKDWPQLMFHRPPDPVKVTA